MSGSPHMMNGVTEVTVTAKFRATWEAAMTADQIHSHLYSKCGFHRGVHFNRVEKCGYVIYTQTYYPY